MAEFRLLNRRSAMTRLTAVAVGTAVSSLPKARGADRLRTTGMGLVLYDCSLRRHWMRQQNPESDLFHPLTFLKHCHAVGAGGMQAALGVLNADEIRQLRGFAEQQDLFLDAIIAPPKDQADLSRFEAEVKTARDAGVLAARTTIIPGRRYEQFKSLAEFRQSQQHGQQMLERAVPVLEKYRVPLAVENHKDQRIDERIALYQHLSCEFIGACVDTGNSFALLEGAYEPVEALAPFAFTVHLKDQALQEYEHGFLLGDIPLGQGSFDIPRIVRTLKTAKPKIRFVLELITRDALRVPCLTDEYWATMPTVPGSDLAKTIQFVRQHRSRHLQEVSTLSLEKQVRLEDANIAASLDFAKERLAL